MDISDKVYIENLLRHVNRSLLRRLRESYLADMVTVLQAANDGKFGSSEAFDIASDLTAKVKILRKGGPLDNLLRKADILILDKVLNDVNSPESEKINVVDLTDQDNSHDLN